MPGSLVILLESADRCLDDESAKMSDWDNFLKKILSSTTLNMYIKLSKIPLFGKLFQRFIYYDLAKTYDIIINFKEAHFSAEGLIRDIIK